MKILSRKLFFLISVVLLSNVFSTTAQAQAQTLMAQAIPDDSLGPESSRVLPVGTATTAGGLSENLGVEGGAARNNVLFHSFSEFNIGSDQRLDFFPDDNITNIFTRVTGSTTSQILGTLGVAGEADLFLLNPNGFFFGAGSKLDINGSFFATSADEVAFGEDFTFNAQSPNLPPSRLLTVQPSALFFNRSDPGEIVSQQGRFVVDAGERVQLIGGSISLFGNPNDRKDRNIIVARQGLVELGGLSSPGTIALTNSGRVRFPEGVRRAEIFLNDAHIIVAGDRNSSIIYANNNIPEDNGDVNFYANNVTLEDSRIQAGFGNGQKAPGNLAGDITIEAYGNFEATANTRVVNSVRENAVGNSGDIIIRAEGNLFLCRSTLLCGNPPPGDLLKNGSQILTLVGEEAKGTVGDIWVMVGGNAQLQNNSSIASHLRGNRQPGSRLAAQRGLPKVDIRVAGDLSLHNSDILNLVENTGTGDAGSLSIQAASFHMETAQGAPENNGIQSLVSTGSSGGGNAGTLSIEADRLTMIGPGVSGPSGIVANADGNKRTLTGNAGSIFIDVAGPITMTNRGKIESRVRKRIGNGGDIFINAHALSLDNVSLIQVRNVGAVGSPGNVSIDLEGGLDLRNRGAISAVITEGAIANSSTQSDTGNVTISADSVRLSQRGLIRVSTLGGGDAGDINVTANTIEIDDVYILGQGDETSSGFFSRTRPTAQGNGGDIFLTAELLRLNGNSVITAETDSDFSGGDIDISAHRVELLNGGQILTSASAQGEAGSIEISASDEVAIVGSDPVFATQLENAQARLIREKISDLRQVINRRGENGVAPSGIFLQSLGTRENAGDAGTLDIKESPGGHLDLILRDGGEINADTVSTMGGNIFLTDLDTVILRNGSRISAEAGSAQRSGNGGNITISIPDGFLVAVPEENSNIIANAFEGEGGRIDIVALNVVGFSNEQNQSPSQKPASTISASSEFGIDGTVNIERLTVDPSSGLIELPTNLADQSNQIAQQCLADNGEGLNAFVVTGQGGSSPSPADVVRNETAGLVDLGIHTSLNMAAPHTTVPLFANDSLTPALETPILEAPILEAQSWQKNAQGEVTLIAQDPDFLSNSLAQSQSCTARRSNNT